MKFAWMVFACLALSVEGIRHQAVANQSSCQTEDLNHRALVQTKLAVFGVECEEMCKKIGMYPNCQCPGFEGNVATDGDMRLCHDQYCQDPATPCPTDGFVSCVKETTKVSTLQWPALFQRFDVSLGPKRQALLQKASTAADSDSCQAQDSSLKVQMLMRMAVLGVECETMCKKIGMYPNCQCPGFEGNVATDGDFRLCFDKECQDPSTPCPTDHFVSCVKASTQVSTLQWPSLLQRFDSYIAHWNKWVTKK